MAWMMWPHASAPQPAHPGQGTTTPTEASRDVISVPTPAQDGEPARRNKAIDHMVYDAVVVRREWPGTVDPSTLAQTLRPWSLAGQYRTWNSVQRPERLPDWRGKRITTAVPDGRSLAALAACWSTSEGFWCSQDDILDALAESASLQPSRTRTDLAIDAARLAVAFGHPDLALDVLRASPPALGADADVWNALWHYARAIAGSGTTEPRSAWSSSAYARRHGGAIPPPLPESTCPAWMERMLDVSWPSTTTPDELCSSLRAAVRTVGQWSPLAIDATLLLLESHGGRDPGVRPQTLVWIAIQAGRVYGPARSFALWPWIQRRGVESLADGKALFHDRFNAAESLIYAGLCLEDAWELRRREDVQRTMTTMGKVATVLATAPGVAAEFPPTWEHRLMIERAIWRQNQLFGNHQANIPLWLSASLDQDSHNHRDLACLQFEDFLRIQAPDAQRALAIIDATCVDFWADHPVAAQTAKALVGKHYQIRELIAEADANIERLAASDNAAVRQDARMYTTAIAPRTRP